MIGDGGNHCLGVSPETAGDSLFNIPRLVSRNMYYRTVVASALIRLLRLVTLARFNDALAFSPDFRLPIIIIKQYEILSRRIFLFEKRFVLYILYACIFK